MNNRIDGFTGTVNEYIYYLEQKVLLLTEHHQTCTIVQRPANEETGPTDGSTLQFIQWDEQSDHSKRRKPTPEWEKKARTLIEATPNAQRWEESVKRLGIHEVMSSGQAAMFMLDGNYPSPRPSQLDTVLVDTSRSMDLFGRLATYARTAVRRDVTASLARMLVNFQKFVLLSSCAVLYHTGSVPEKVLEVVKICLGNVTDRYCVQVLRTTVYLNQLIDTLNAHGCGDRASELVLLWNEPPAWYFAMASSPTKSLHYLLSAAEFTMRDDPKNSTPFFVPSLVQQVLEKKFQYAAFPSLAVGADFADSVARISHVLGYQHAHIFKDPVNPWQYFDND